MVVQFNAGSNDTVAQNVANVLNAQVGSSGVIVFFDGTQPAATTDADDGTELASCALSATPFVYDSGGDFHADTISDGTVVADGTALYWRVKTGGGTVVFQGACNITAAEIIFNTIDWLTSETVSITSFTFLSILAGD